MLQQTNADGTWVKLDKDSMQRYCHEIDGEAWSLSRGNDDITYLQHEAELSSEIEDDRKSTFGFSGDPATEGSPKRGFDFTTAPQTPSFSSFGQRSGTGRSCDGHVTIMSFIFCHTTDFY